jgi:two-component system, NtrC family, response regulator HydG
MPMQPPRAPFKPSDLVTARRPKFTRPESTAGASFVLAVVDGPDAGVVVTLDGTGPTRALLGQSPVCSVRLTDPEVSRRHAALAVMDTHLQIIDLGSTNGTTVNGVTIKEASLLGGEAIRVGRSVLSVRRDAPRFAELTQAGAYGRVVGESTAMKKLFAVFSTLATNDRAVLLEGETGTGKELVAEELHRASRRKDAPFVTLEATTVPTQEMHERLFGSPSDPGGLVDLAAGGVLFVDEIGDVPLEVQIKLRAAIASGPDVRLIAGTRRDLDRDVASGRFSEDLFFLLAPGRVELPPLRDRQGDVAVLARHFWTTLSSHPQPSAPRELETTAVVDDVSGQDARALPEDFLPRFEHYPWPGNVRELRSAVLARMTLGELGPSYRSDAAREQGLDLITAVIEEDLPFPMARERVVKEFERRYVERVLARHGGHIGKAAAASGVAHRYFKLIRARLK